MSEIVTYERTGRAARIRMNDGKVNAMSIAMVEALHAAFDRAAEEEAIAVLSSRAPVFSAGFDLNVIRSGDAITIRTMVKLGAELALKLLSFPTPVITVTAGHAYPMGAFLMLAADWRIGVQGSWRTGLNEVQIGLTVPDFGLELARQRLTPAYFSRTAVTGELFLPEQALEAGFIDQLVSAAHLHECVEAAVARLEGLHPASHAATKLKARSATIAAMRAAIDRDFGS
jgi:enoyl-CoA hydratase/carnithine racemase